MISFLTTSGQCWTTQGQTWPKSTQIWSMSGQCRSIQGQNWPNLAGQIWPILVEFGAILADVGPALVESGRSRARYGRFRAEVGGTWPSAARIGHGRPESGGGVGRGRRAGRRPGHWPWRRTGRHLGRRTSTPVLRTLRRTCCAWSGRPISTAALACGLRPLLATLTRWRRPRRGRRDAGGGRPTRSAPTPRPALPRAWACGPGRSQHQPGWACLIEHPLSLARLP